MRWMNDVTFASQSEETQIFCLKIYNSGTKKAKELNLFVFWVEVTFLVERLDFFNVLVNSYFYEHLFSMFLQLLRSCQPKRYISPKIHIFSFPTTPTPIFFPKTKQKNLNSLAFLVLIDILTYNSPFFPTDWEEKVTSFIQRIKT